MPKSNEKTYQKVNSPSCLRVETASRLRSVLAHRLSKPIALKSKTVPPSVDDVRSFLINELLHLLDAFFVERSPSNIIAQMNELLDVFLKEPDILSIYTEIERRNIVYQHNCLVIFIIELSTKHLNVRKDPTTSVDGILTLLDVFFMERSPSNIIAQMSELLNAFLGESDSLNRYASLNLQNMVYQHNCLVLFIVQLSEKHDKIRTQGGK